jgi:CHAD domain-containing protein
MTHLRPPLARCSTGELVRRLVAGHVSRLVDLQIPVLADDDPEPLHQMRVAMRRLRTTLRQFAPAVVLPGGVSDQRIARSVRRLGLARDLDVLRQRLRDELPALPQQEAAALKPVFRQLKRERRVAYTQLVEVLRGRSHLELLARLQEWLRRPEFTPLGREPLGRWLPEWQLPPLLQLFVHSGWWAEDPQGQAERVHDLRKQIKDARYRLENLRHCGGRRQRAAITDLRDLQELLGELHDLEVLTAAIDQQTPHSLASDLPVLAVALEQRRRCCWERWRDEARRLNSAAARAELLHGLQREQARHRLKVVCSVIHGRVSPRLATAMACR